MYEGFENLTIPRFRKHKRTKVSQTRFTQMSKQEY